MLPPKSIGVAEQLPPVLFPKIVFLRFVVPPKSMPPPISALFPEKEQLAILKSAVSLLIAPPKLVLDVKIGGVVDDTSQAAEAEEDRGDVSQADIPPTAVLFAKVLLTITTWPVVMPA